MAFNMSTAVKCPPPIPNLLIYTRTLAFRHDSIPTAANVIAEWGMENNLWNSVHTEDPSIFTDEGLAQFKGMVWISTTGQVINGSQTTAFENWLQKGGNFAAIHDATNSLLNDTFYGNLTGAYFCCHPMIQNATYEVSHPWHPAVQLLPPVFEHYDEIYQYRSDPRTTNIKLLLSAEQNTYNTTIGTAGFRPPVGLTPGGPPQPISWYRDPGYMLAWNLTHNGRLFQTGLGHANSTWLNDTLFRDHIFGGMNWILETDVTNFTAPASDMAAAAEASAVSMAAAQATATPSSTGIVVPRAASTTSAAQPNLSVGGAALAAVAFHLAKPILGRFFSL